MTKPNNQPSHGEAPQQSDTESVLGKLAVEFYGVRSVEVVPPMYRLGDGQKRREHLIDGRRVLSWRLMGNEAEIAPLAGWQNMDYVVEEGEGYLEVPEGTRNARSILSGMEAYKGEKAQIVTAASMYLKNLKNKFHHDDTSFSWESVGVTPAHEVFIAPPHILDIGVDKETATQWKHDVAEELRLLLQNDNQNQTLITDFREAIK